MKKMKRVSSIAMIISLILTMLFSDMNVAAYSTTTTGTGTIAPTKAQFSSAKTPLYNTYSFCKSGKITKSYQLDIYHYEAPESGYYIVYTTGSLDTVCAVFEQQNVVGITTNYKKVGANDDGYFLNYGRNSAVVIRMDKGEDYYICVRGFSSNTGTYYLNVAPNKDEIISNNGGYWVGKYIPSRIIATGTYLTEKQYLTKEQVIFLYWLLDPASCESATAQGYSVEVLRSKYDKNIADAIDYSNTIISAITSSSNSASITSTLLTSFIDKSHAESTMSDREMQEILVNKCGLKHDVATGKWSATYGLRAEKKYTFWALTTYDYKYYSSNTTRLTGATYYDGNWK